MRASGMSSACFADEVALGFPAVGPVVERMRDGFLGDDDGADVLSTAIRVSAEDAWRGRVVSLEVPVSGPCPGCGGRGETWADPCRDCVGTGNAASMCVVHLALPRRLPDGSLVRFRIHPPHAPVVRVEVRVAIDATTV